MADDAPSFSDQLFPSSATVKEPAARTPTAAPPAAPERSTADVLYGDPSIVMRHTFHQLHDDQKAIGRTDAEIAAFKEDALALGRAIDPYLVAEIVEASEREAVAEWRRGEDLEYEKNFDKRNAEWQETTNRQLHATYGDSADELLARTKAFVNSHPKLASMLGKNGLGSRPDIVLPLARYVWRQWRG